MKRINGGYHGELISPEYAESFDDITQINIPPMGDKVEDAIGLFSFATTRKTVVIAGKELNIERKYPKMSKVESLVANLRKAIKSYATKTEKIGNFTVNLIPLNIAQQKNNIVKLELGVEIKFKNGRKRRYKTCIIINTETSEAVAGTNLCDLTIERVITSGNLLFSLFKSAKTFQAGDYIYANTREFRIEKVFVSFKMRGIVASPPKTVIVQPFGYFIKPEQTVINFVRDGDKVETYVTIFGSGVGIKTRLTDVDTPKIFSLLLALNELGNVKFERSRSSLPGVLYKPSKIEDGVKILRANFNGVGVIGLYVKKVFHCKNRSLEPAVYIDSSTIIIPVEGNLDKLKAYIVFKNTNVPIIARCIFEKTP